MKDSMTEEEHLTIQQFMLRMEHIVTQDEIYFMIIPQKDKTYLVNLVSCEEQSDLSSPLKFTHSFFFHSI
jgi:hypothetical protein